MTRAAVTLALLVAAAGCSGDGSGGDGPDAGGDGDGDGDIDLSRASWAIEPVDDGPTNISFDPAIAAIDGGTLFAWVDLTVGTNAYQVFSTAAPGGAAEPRGDLSTDGTFRLTQLRPGAGGGAHLAVGGGPRDMPEDIFYASFDGAAWGPLVDISTAVDPDDLDKTEPTAVDLGDAIAAVFLAREAAAAPDGVYAIRFSDPASPGPLETVLDRARYDCSDLETRAIGASVHIIAACTLDGAERQLYYATDRSGSFVVQAVDLGASRLPFDPDFAVDEGGELHVVWVGTVDCEAGACREVFYSRNLAPPTPVTNQGGDGGFRPRVAVDRAGRPIVVYHRQEIDATLHWTYAESAGSFVRSQLVVPPVAGERDWLAGGLEIGADGAPRVVFVHTFGGTPANTDILSGVLGN